MGTDRAILCVDDEVIILLAMLQELKGRFGDRFLYESAYSADEALLAIEELAQEGVKVILIITDWLMPGIKGDEFLEIVRTKYPGIKAIMVTGHADRVAKERVERNESVLAVLNKPWKSEELAAIIDGACA